MKCVLFYKPYNVLCQFTEPDQSSLRKTLKDYIAIPNVYPVGRLDLDSEGLLLLTDNGQLRIPDQLALDKLRQGIKIKDYITRPAKVSFLKTEPFLPDRNPPIRFRKNVPTSWLEITLTEGRNRQVRRMTAAIGFPTLRLVRVAMKITNFRTKKDRQLRLDGLEPGQWRELDKQEWLWLQKLI